MKTTTISFASGTGSGGSGGSGGSDFLDAATVSDRGSARDSAHETIRTEETDQDAGGEGGHSRSGVPMLPPLSPQSPVAADMYSEASVASANSVASVGSGSGNRSGSSAAAGSGPAPSIVRLASPAGSHAAASTAGHSAATTTGTNSSSTVTNPGTSNSSGHNTVAGNSGHRPLSLAPVTSVSTATISSVVDDRTITATIDLLKGGCLAGEVVSVKVSVQHVKRIKSLHGVIVTLYRQGRIDSAPPSFMFASAGSSIAEEDETVNGDGATEGSGHNRAGGSSNTEGGSRGHEQRSSGGVLGSTENAGNGQLSRKQKKREDKKDKDTSAKTPKELSRDGSSSQRRRSKPKSGSSDKDNGVSKLDNYYPKSKTGLGGLSLTSAGSCSVFRKDLSQSFSPLIIDPRTLQSSVTASVRVPEDAFATIKGVPGDMISFKYQLEVIVDLGGKLASLLQSGAGTAGPNVVSTSHPFDGKPLLAPGSALWRGGGHIVDTDQLRRQKGVIHVVFEVVVGTTDTSRQRSRGMKAVATAGDAQLHLTEAYSQPQYPDQHQQLEPYSSPHPPDWYPDDRKGKQQQQKAPYPAWPANGAASGGAGPSAPDARPASDSYYHHQQQQQQQHSYYQYEQQPEYTRGPYNPHSRHQAYDYYDGDPGSSTAAPRPPYTGRLPPPSIQAPQYVPTAAMLAAEHDPNVPEKERIRRAEERLLPSQPGALSGAVAGAAAGASGDLGSSRDAGGNGASGHGRLAPTAPSLDELDYAADDATLPPPPPLTEDKQELERRRLLAEASAPPDFPDDYEDSSRPGGWSQAAGAARLPSVPGIIGSAAGSMHHAGSSTGVAGPSAPVLEEEDGHFHDQPRYQQYEPHSQPPYHGQGGDASAPPADLFAGDDVAGPVRATSSATAIAGPSGLAASPPTTTPAGATDEDRYGQNYTYGPGTSGTASHGDGATEPAEPLPAYER